MKTPETSSLFTRYDDPCGHPFYILTARVAPQQQGFYFVNNSMSDDGRYLWFYTSFPPAGDMENHQLGVVDFLKDEIHYFPDSSFCAAAPVLERGTYNIIFATGNRVLRRSPDPNKPAEVLYTIPTTGRCSRLCTHLTYSADGKELFIDYRAGNDEFAFGSLNLESGVFTPWGHANASYNHAQFNPVRQDLALLAMDSWFDLITGLKHGIPYDKDGVYQRLWTCTRDGEMKCWPPANNYATHEWWGASGKNFYYCNPHGIIRQNIDTGACDNIHACDPWHTHCTADEMLYVFDEKVLEPYDRWYRGCASRVHFWNAKTDKEVVICTLNPNGEYTPDNPNNYHIDPHPRFTDNEKYVVFTTTVLGTVDVAMVPVADLLERTR